MSLSQFASADRCRRNPSGFPAAGESDRCRNRQIPNKCSKDGERYKELLEENNRRVSAKKPVPTPVNIETLEVAR